MKYFKWVRIGLFVFLSLNILGCKNRVIDKLLPDTQQFLISQEQSRCACLDQYGQRFVEEMNASLVYIDGLPDQYNLDSLKLSEFYAIKLELVDAMSMIKTLTSCVNSKAVQLDQFTGMLMQEDLRVVLEIDSTMTEQEKFDRMNIPGLELTDEYCPQHKQAMLKFYEMIKAAQVLPPGLQ
ncbi:MAG TPA: hypothetical protein EYN89_13755 [Flavobacteriales bacterium]|nr:hypothetical protein [Flavobacteriales bacterium]